MRRNLLLFTAAAAAILPLVQSDPDAKFFLLETKNKGGSKSIKPADKNAQPAGTGNNTQPADKSAKPADKSVQPAGKSAKPDGQSAKPGKHAGTLRNMFINICSLE